MLNLYNIRQLYIKFILINILLIFTRAQNDYNIIQETLTFLRRGENNMNLENYDNNIKMEKVYDFVVVGAGTAGCVLAARLSENPKWKVLLLESGGPETLIMDVPIVAHFLQLGEMNWKYRTEPSDKACLAMTDNRCNWPRGKVMGGSSVLNYMMYTRGNHLDYDRWAELGNEGWSFRDVLPYFKKFEGSTVPDADSKYVGRNGPVKISYCPWRSQLSDVFVQAAQEDGLSYCDYNGISQYGVAYLQSTIFNSTRWSSNRAYLYPLKGRRRNLHIKKKALVTKILIDPLTKIAYGIELQANGIIYKITARKEVIVTAGAINTPQLLMLSGIGPTDHLRNIGIEPLVNLAVGYNLQDHTAAPLTFTTNVTTLHIEDMLSPTLMYDYNHNKGLWTSPGGAECIGFWNLDKSNQQVQENETVWPDMELFLVNGAISSNPASIRGFGLKRSIYDAMFAELESSNINAFSIFSMILRPKSRGRIMLKSKDPYTHPLIYANYFDHPYDLDISVRGLLKSISLTKRPAFRKVKAKLWNRIVPTCRQYPYKSRAYWECYVRHFTLTIYHYSGTAKMGPQTDPTAVVDPRLRVYGIKNLRVADASIMPEIISGHPNGPVFMIAEKAADIIKQDYGFTS